MILEVDTVTGMEGFYSLRTKTLTGGDGGWGAMRDSVVKEFLRVLVIH